MKLMGAASLLLTLLLTAGSGPETGKYFTITVVDEDTGRGVPLVELTTVGAVRYYSDSNGIVAFYEPGLMGQEVFFHVKSHGYEFPADGFGYRGTRLQVTEGGSAVLKIQRLNIAERLYRVTGAGIYRDSVLVGHATPTDQPVLNGLVMGSDSVLNVVYKGRLHWFWGDTAWPRYPLGNFHASGATSRLPGDGGLDPAVGVNLNYFVDERGFAKPMAPMPGEGPTWLDGLVVVRDATGQERMFAAYAKVHANMEAYQRGLVVFNDASEQFEKVAEFDLAAPVHPGGHPFERVVDGTEYIYYAAPFPIVRVRADAERLADLSAYEAFSCLKTGSRLDEPQLDRATDGTLRYEWRRNTPPVGPAEQAKLIEAGVLKQPEALFQVQDVETSQAILVHNGSVYWNEYRCRWVLVFVEQFGSSMLGEIWYAEGDSPLGPWVYAVKIITHDQYSFYNPKHHPAFDQDRGRVIFFEGTYTHTFSGNPDRTPRYDYNQIMYKLDLSDPRVALPVAIYDVSSGDAPCRFASIEQISPAEQDRRDGWERPIAFFAPERPRPGTVPVYAAKTASGEDRLTLDPRAAESAGAETSPVFYALPADAKTAPAPTVALHEFVHEATGKRAYSADPSWSRPGYVRAEKPLCRVWRNPMRPTLVVP
jgi:hypothetical protein